MRETWYMLENGHAADPNEVAPDDGGVLRHKSGVAVAMRGQVPHSIGVDADEERAKAKDMKPEQPKPIATTGEVKAESSKRGYRTRQVKSH